MSKHLFSAIFIALFISINFSQAQIYIGEDDTICGNTVTLSAQVTPYEVIVNATNVYAFDPIPFAPLPPGGTFINLTDDAVSTAQPIGFTFKFFENEYTQFYIGSNGWISFSPGQTTSYTSATIPSTAANVPKNCIMGPWQDWHPGVGPNVGQYISYRTEGIAPCRKLIVTFNEIPMYQCTSLFGTFQIIIYETTNAIENYITNKPNCPTWAGGTATQGVHNINGTIAYTAPNRNSTQWTTTNEGTSFVAVGDPLPPQPINYTVRWYADGQFIGEGDQFTHTVANNPTQFVGEVNYGCGLESFFDTIMIYQIPFEYEFETNRASCEVSPDGSGNFTITFGETGPYAFRWLDEQGNPIQENLNVIDTVSIDGLVPGAYNLIVSDSQGCQLEIPFSIGQLSAELLLSSTDAICPFSFTGTASVEIDGVEPPYTYAWELNGLEFATTPEVNQLFPSPNPYYVNVGYGIGCIITDSILIGQPAFVSETSSTPASCFGTADGSASVLVTLGTGPFSFTWNPGNINGETITDVTNGMYYVTIVDGNGCNILDSVLVGSPSEIVTEIFQTTAKCEEANGSINLGNSTGGNGAPYTYFWPHSEETTSNVSNLAAGEYQVIVTDANGCSQTETINIDNIPSPTALFSINPEDFGPNNVPIDFTDLSFSDSSAIIGWNWDFGGVGTSNQQNPSFSFPEAGNYDITLIVETTEGCFDTLTIAYVIGGEIEVPNVFTPNGDGQNDFFQIPNIQFFKGNMVLILNRWGRKVFEAEDYNNDTVKWDGGESPDGTYFFIIDIPDREPKKGTVTVIRK